LPMAGRTILAIKLGAGGLALAEEYSRE